MTSRQSKRVSGYLIIFIKLGFWQLLICLYFFSEIRAFYETMWKEIVQPGRPQLTIWRMCIACWMPKATNAHSEYVTLIAFLLQQWLQERVSVLRYTYIASPVISYNGCVSGWARLFKIVRLNYGFSQTACSDGHQCIKPMRSVLKFCMDFQTR